MPNLEVMSTDELLDGYSRDKFVQEEALIILSLLQRGLITTVRAELSFNDGRKFCRVEYLEPADEDEEGAFIFTDMEDNLLADAYDPYEASVHFLQKVGSRGWWFHSHHSE